MCGITQTPVPHDTLKGITRPVFIGLFCKRAIHLKSSFTFIGRRALTNDSALLQKCLTKRRLLYIHNLEVWGAYYTGVTQKVLLH